MTLEQAVFAGIVDPGNLVPVREILDRDSNPVGATPTTNAAGTCTNADFGITSSDVPPASANCDVAEYQSGPENFTVAANADGSVTVTDQTTVAAAAGAVGPIAKGDGIDTLWNIEALRFCIANDAVTKNCILWQTFAIGDPAVSGSGGPASAALVGASPLAFGSLAVGTGPAARVVIIRNTGGGFLVGSPATITGANAADFTIINDGCNTTVLGGGGICTVDVGFSPATAGGGDGHADRADDRGQRHRGPERHRRGDRNGRSGHDRQAGRASAPAGSATRWSRRPWRSATTAPRRS